MALLDDIIAKLVKIRGSGKDVHASLLPIFAAMDTKKHGELAPPEFKTCLLAIGIRATEEKIITLFDSFDKAHLRPGYRVHYSGFIKSMVAAMPPLEGTSNSSTPTKRFVSALVSPSSPTAPRQSDDATRTSNSAFFSSVGFGGSSVALSDDVGEFEDKVNELERTLTEVCKELKKTQDAIQETRAAKDNAENNGVTTASEASEGIAAKNQEIGDLNTEISDLAESIKMLKNQESELQSTVAAKEVTAKKNRIRRKDKDALIMQLQKATVENDNQLAELQAVADELVANLKDTEAVIGDKNAVISGLLSPSKPPQSITLKTVSSFRAEKNTKSRLAERHKAAAQQRK